MDGKIDVVDMYEGVPMYSGHESIYLCYYQVGLFDCSPGNVNTDAQ